MLVLAEEHEPKKESITQLRVLSLGFRVSGPFYMFVVPEHREPTKKENAQICKFEPQIRNPNPKPVTSNPHNVEA